MQATVVEHLRLRAKPDVLWLHVPNGERRDKITAAKLVYFTPQNVEQTLAHARRLLANAGWVETRSDRFVNAEKFAGVWAEFTKGEDLCRLTVIEGTGATHVDYTLARVNPGS